LGKRHGVAEASSDEIEGVVKKVCAFMMMTR
jgi:hypothetical protein